MSYQVLARKWRPKTFESLVGQEHVVRALTHALGESRLHHAYLFTGTRGVGKTTLARILAKSLNCEQGISATPCGVCSTCTEIDAGRFVDLLEVDAATNTKVDEMRQLLENAVYAPTRGRFKVYVIDEVHMLSNSAFNAMLKTLEEPPDHVKFILATTDPQKIPVTVLSRCLQFNLKQMTPPLIAGHLKQILEVEAIAAEPGALNLLARSANGSMRDALSLLDQAIAHGAGKVEEAQVRSMLGTVDLDYLFNILEALLAGDAAGMVAVADDMALRSLSFDAALQELATLFTRLQVAQLAPQAIADELPERERLIGLAARLDPEFVQLGYQIAVHGRKELPLAPDERSGFVMTLLRLHVFRPASGDAPPAPPRSGDGGSGRAAHAAHAAQAPVAQVAPATAAPAAAKASRPTAAKVAAPAPEMSPAAPDAVPKNAPKVAEAPTAVPNEALNERPPEAPSDEAAAPGVATSADDWPTILESLKIGGMARELGQHCALRRIEGARVELCLAPEHRHLQMKPAHDKLQQALSDYLGRTVSLSISQEEITGDTPAAAAQRRRRERQSQAVASLEGDDFVREVIDAFDATLVESSIRPV